MVIERPLRTIDQVASSSLFFTQELTSSGIASTDKHGKVDRDPVLYDCPCYSGVSQAPFLRDRPGALPFGNALASDAPLQLCQLGFATQVHPTLTGSSSAVIGTLHDPLAFVLRQGTQ
jgi:hypothetical protein